MYTVSLTLILLAAAAGYAAGAADPPQCYELDIEQCSNLSYNMTTVSEKEQWDVIEKISVFEKMAGQKCSTVLTPFLCFSLAPKCRPDIAYPIKPCRETCLRVKEECSGSLSKMLVGWADELDCDTGYEAKGEARCMSYGKLEKLLAGTVVPANV